jgi:sec-independent protein translocase protein TatB
MFDIGWSELLVIAIVALVVIGPKDLPQAFRVLGRWMAKARALASDFQGHVDDLMREADMQDMKRDFQDMTRVPEFEALEGDLMRGELAGSSNPATPAKPATTAGVAAPVAGASPAVAPASASPEAAAPLPAAPSP